MTNHSNNSLFRHWACDNSLRTVLCKLLILLEETTLSSVYPWWHGFSLLMLRIFLSKERVGEDGEVPVILSENNFGEKKREAPICVIFFRDLIFAQNTTH